MRISLAYSILLASSIQLLAHNINGQTIDKETVTIELQNDNLVTLIQKIESQSTLRFIYQPEQLNKYSGVSLAKAKRTIKETLDLALNGTGLKYEQNGRYVLVNEKAVAVSSVLSASLVKGKVTDEDGVGIAGVNVVIKGTSNGTTTDGDGTYAILAEADDILIFSFIGYKTIEMAIGARTTVDMAMALDVAALKVVEVNVGYWTVDKKRSTGSITSVSGEDIAKQPVNNPLAALSGRMPGVYIQQTSGVPGGGFNITIRGRNSIRNNLGDNGNLPLYIVDGVPFSSTPYTSGVTSVGIIGGGNPLSAINPSDIASIEVLKDADATAIYGSRGANGVVLITTKKGKSGRPRFDLNVSKGAGQVSRKIDLMNTSQYIAMRREAYRNDGVDPQSWAYDVNGTWDTVRYTDWQKKFIGGTAQYTNLQGTISGGSESMRFLLGAGYLKETTVFPADYGNEKASVNLNVTYSDPGSKFKAMTSVVFVNNRNDLPAGDLTSNIFLAPNTPDIYNDDGSLNWDPTWPSGNPFAILSRKYIDKADNLIANVNMSYDIAKGLSIKTNLGFNSIYANSISTNPLSSINPSNTAARGSAFFFNRDSRSWIVEPQLEYVKSVGGGELNVLLGSTFQKSVTEGSTVYADGYTNDILIEDLFSAPSVFVLGSEAVEYKYGALFGRLNYSWRDKYIINATGRRDGSSKFGANNRFSNFGAIGLAWVLSEENFIRTGLPFLSHGKLRGSYGLTGSDQIPDYGYFDTYTSTGYNYNSSPGLVPSRIPNPDYSWERNKKVEMALELGFLGDRVRLDVAHFRNRSSNQLVGYSLAPSAGFGTVQYNLPATVQNTGWELEFTSLNVQRGAFSWQTSINVTLPRNKLVAFPNLEGSPYASYYEVGRALSVRKAYHYTGINRETGLYTFEDVDGDGRYTPADYRAHFTGQKAYGGIQNSISYRGFQIDFLFQFVKQTGANYLRYISWIPGGYNINQPTDVMRRWRGPSDATNVQRYTQGNFYEYFDAQQSDLSTSDGSFIRLKNVMVSYSLARSFANRMRLQNVKIFAQGQNLLTFTNYLGSDPEGLSGLVLPALRVFTLGINLSL